MSDLDFIKNLPDLSETKKKKFVSDKDVSANARTYEKLEEFARSLKQWAMENNEILIYTTQARELNQVPRGMSMVKYSDMVISDTSEPQVLKCRFRDDLRDEILFEFTADRVFGIERKS